ncbi:hypothetical protein IF1G_04419 [Cordyceps javanica]|uniref:Uncharacterized protein n=1 Tax=Cordyceps javanica TaxID=43265 RepID=A0A545V638_9HYPO|nr:hypothetical protein IF1G_04419 [Cordyceps javanica]
MLLHNLKEKTKKEVTARSIRIGASLFGIDAHCARPRALCSAYRGARPKGRSGDWGGERGDAKKGFSWRWGGIGQPDRGRLSVRR